MRICGIMLAEVSDLSRILTVEEAATKLRVKPSTVREYLKRGMIPGRKLGRSWRIVETELDSFLSSSRPIPLSERISARGIASDIKGLSSEDFMRRKQDEIEWENRRFREDAA